MPRRSKPTRSRRERTTKRPPPRTGRPWRVVCLVLALGASLAVFGPPVQVATLLVIHPPLTGTRLQRAVQAAAGGDIPRQQHHWRSLDQIDADLPQAVLVAEDQRFWVHGGFDLDQVQQALSDHDEGRPLRGASTLTMQAARTLFLWQGRSWSRKGLEAVYTVWMELLLPKDRILELYLNEVEWGPQVFGAEAAAREHFDGSADDLTRTQACALAATLPSPNTRDPADPSATMLRKMRWIEGQMDLSLPTVAPDDDATKVH